MTSAVLDDLLPEPELADEMSRSRRTLQRWRDEGVGPAYIQIGKQIFYRRAAIREWLLSLETTPARRAK